MDIFEPKIVIFSVLLTGQIWVYGYFYKIFFDLELEEDTCPETDKPFSYFQILECESP